MVALQIRNVPEDVRDVLAERARARGQSLQAFLLSVIEEEARRAHILALLERFAGRTDGASETAEDTVALIERERRARDERLVG